MKHEHSGADSATKKRRVPVWLIVIFCVAVVCAIAGGVYLVSMQAQLEKVESLDDVNGDPVEPEENSDDEEELPTNPIDFASLKQENNDIYAWLSVPGTSVSEPILQSATDDNYYLTHDRTGAENANGAIFTQSANSTDFSDPVTVIYGHVIHGDNTKLLFSTLHYFEDADFFNEHDTFYIYTPGHILTYEIVSAYKYDDRHILNSFDFSDPDVRREYFDYVVNPDSLVKNVREGVTLSDDDKIVQLSTCMQDEWHGPDRYIVTGVLRDDQATQ